jgi:RHS repeat-associated protein
MTRSATPPRPAQRERTRLRYTGRECDATGLYFYRTRYYSPAFGRFIGEDPIFPRERNQSVYVHT